MTQKSDIAVIKNDIKYIKQATEEIKLMNLNQNKRIDNIEKFQERIKGMYGALILIGTAIGTLIGWLISIFRK